jgi:hypothetical protein
VREREREREREMEGRREGERGMYLGNNSNEAEDSGHAQQNDLNLENDEKKSRVLRVIITCV